MSDNTRASVTTVRNHQRFLLRQVHFTQQFAGIYRIRTKLLRDRVLHRSLQIHGRPGKKTSAAPTAVRVLGLVPGVESLVVGTIYKNMKNFVGFLAEYQKELVRIEAGDDEDGDNEGVEEALAEEIHAEEVVEGAKQPASNAMYSPNDTVVLEDESGRVELSGVPVNKLVTGMVVAVYGTLMEKGKFEVKDLFFPGLPEGAPRAFPSGSKPCYVAFVSGLGVGCKGDVPLALGKLLAYLVGDTSVYSPGGSAPDATSIAKVIVGGNIVEATEEYFLKQKVRLDPSDHIKIADTANKLTAANSMQSADAFLAALADSVEVDIMPGDKDPSNAYLPQQPLHPVLLRATSRKPTVRLVTNPYDVSISPNTDGAAAARMFVTSGQNLEDLMRQTSFTSNVEAMQALLDSGCACPTAPNTLLCYPFEDDDPFTFVSPPDAFVCCNASHFETANHGGVRYVSVPSFKDTGVVVLMDVASPHLDTVAVTFSV